MVNRMLDHLMERQNIARMIIPLEAGEIKGPYDEAPDGYRTETDDEFRRRALEEMARKDGIELPG